MIIFHTTFFNVAAAITLDLLLQKPNYMIPIMVLITYITYKPQHGKYSYNYAAVRKHSVHFKSDVS